MKMYSYLTQCKLSFISGSSCYPLFYKKNASKLHVCYLQEWFHHWQLDTLEELPTCSVKISCVNICLILAKAFAFTGHWNIQQTSSIRTCEPANLCEPPK